MIIWGTKLFFQITIDKTPTSCNIYHVLGTECVLWLSQVLQTPHVRRTVISPTGKTREIPEHMHYPGHPYYVVYAIQIHINKKDIKKDKCKCVKEHGNGGANNQRWEQNTM